jgi:hypothetical protein
MNTRFLITLSVILSTPALALAHGLPFIFDVNPSGDYQSSVLAYHQPVLEPVEQHDSVFESGSYTVGGVPTPSLQWLGAFTPLAPPAPGGEGHIAVGSTYRFDAVGPLLFWDPTLGITPTGETLVIVRSNQGVSVDQNSGVVTGINLTVPPTGYNGLPGAHSSASFNLPPGAAPGLYVVGLRIVSTNDTTYGASNTFYAIGVNDLTMEQFESGMDAFRAVGVPEPPSILMAAIVLVAAGLAGWSRKIT